MASPGLTSVSFEVFGRVQGVFFRKHTQATAQKLGLVGWVQNTPAGTVTGCVEGPEEKVKIMKNWLREKGSPKSRIDKCEFREEKKIQSKTFSNFSVKR